MTPSRPVTLSRLQQHRVSESNKLTDSAAKTTVAVNIGSAGEADHLNASAANAGQGLTADSQNRANPEAVAVDAADALGPDVSAMDAQLSSLAHGEALAHESALMHESALSADPQNMPYVAPVALAVGSDYSSDLPRADATDNMAPSASAYGSDVIGASTGMASSTAAAHAALAWGATGGTATAAPLHSDGGTAAVHTTSYQPARSWYSPEYDGQLQADLNALQDVDVRELQDFAYNDSDDELSAESFQRLLRLRAAAGQNTNINGNGNGNSYGYGGNGDSVPAAMPTAIDEHGMPRGHIVPTPDNLPRSFTNPPYAQTLKTPTLAGTDQKLMVVNATATTTPEDFAYSLSRQMSANGVGLARSSQTQRHYQKLQAQERAALAMQSNDIVGKSQIVTAGGLSSAAPASSSYTPYVAVAADDLSSATKVTVNSNDHELSARLRITAAEAEAQAQAEAAARPATRVSATPAVSDAQQQAAAAAAANAAATQAVQSAVAAAASMPPVSSEVAILDAVAAAQQRLHAEGSGLPKTMVYNASNCGSDPVISGAAPEVTSAIAAFAAAEQERAQKAQQASSQLVQEITAKGHTVVTGQVELPDVTESSTAEVAADTAMAQQEPSSHVRIVRAPANPAFVPSMEGVVSTDLGRRIQGQGALVAQGLRSSINNATAQALGLTTTSSVVSWLQQSEPELGLGMGVSTHSAYNLNASQRAAVNAVETAKRYGFDQGFEPLNHDSSRVGVYAQEVSPEEVQARLRAQAHKPEDEISNAVLVQNATTCIVTNSRKAKSDFEESSRIVAAQEAAAQEAAALEAQSDEPATVISQNDILVGFAQDLLDGLGTDALAPMAPAAPTAKDEAASSAAAASPADEAAPAPVAEAAAESILQPQTAAAAAAVTGAESATSAATAAPEDAAAAEEAEAEPVSSAQPVKTTRAKRATSRTSSSTTSRTRRTTRSRSK